MTFYKNSIEKLASYQSDQSSWRFNVKQETISTLALKESSVLPS